MGNFSLGSRNSPYQFTGFNKVSYTSGFRWEWWGVIYLQGFWNWTPDDLISPVKVLQFYHHIYHKSQLSINDHEVITTYRCTRCVFRLSQEWHVMATRRLLFNLTIITLPNDLSGSCQRSILWSSPCDAIVGHSGRKFLIRIILHTTWWDVT